MKEKIIFNIKTLTEELVKKGGSKKEWEEFLISSAEFYGNIDFEKKMTEPIIRLIESVDINVFIDGLEYIKSQIEEFPKETILKNIIKINKELIDKKNNIIKELREVLEELATPTIRIWKDIVLVPLIGTLDSERAQSMAEKLLNFASSNRAKVVIVDVTGVALIDTIVGGFLIEMFNAVKFLGCEVILTGINPNIAHTLVKLGINFNMVTVKRDLESGLKHAINIIEKENIK